MQTRAQRSSQLPGLCIKLVLLSAALALLVAPTSAVDAGQYAHDMIPPNDDMPNEAVDLNAAAAKGPDFGGGLESMLHWAISHSDPEVLKREAEDARTQEAITNMLERKARVKQLIDVMNDQPTETGLIKEAVAILTHPESGPEQQLSALQALQILVEPIDNANDLKPLGGLGPIMAALDSSNSSLQAAAAYVVGTAASNNPKFQGQLLELHPGVFTRLVQLISAGEGEVVVKGLYAVASLVRNLPGHRDTFLEAGGLDAVQHVLLHASPMGSSTGGMARMDHRAQRKALALIIDLVHLDTEVAAKCLEKDLPVTISEMLHQPDSDLQEKALDAMKTLMRYSTQAAASFQAAGAVAGTDKLHAELLEHAMAAAGDLDDHYMKYLLGLVVEVQVALKKAAQPHAEL